MGHFHQSIYPTLMNWTQTPKQYIRQSGKTARAALVSENSILGILQILGIPLSTSSMGKCY